MKYNWKVTDNKKMKKNHIKSTLVFLKYTAGSVGVGTVIADYKWVGVACLVVGAAADAALKAYFNEATA